jgi:hypothetical protein
MKHGDLSNHTPPRVLVVFERLLVTVPEKREVRFARLMGKRNYAGALGCLELDQDVANVLRGWAWTKDVRVDVVSHLAQGADYRAAVEEFLRLEDVPSQLVHARPQQSFTDEIRARPDVSVVFHRDPSPFAYGSLGHPVTSAAALRLAL